MIILTMRTDNPEAEIGLYEDEKQIAYYKWHAHRELAATLHQKIKDMLEAQGHVLKDIGGIVCLKGPGSFTGLRIGITVADALAFGLKVPIVGIVHESEWIEQGLVRLKKGESDHIITPEYGAPVHITQSKN